MKHKEKDVRGFLSGLDDQEFRYLRIQINLASDARELVKKFRITKDDFCSRMQIYKSDYENYMNGGYEYRISDMALMQAAYCDLSTIEADKEVKKNFTGVVND